MSLSLFYMIDIGFDEELSNGSQTLANALNHVPEGERKKAEETISKLAQLAIRDDTTELFNKRKFRQDIKEALKRTEETYEISLLMIDLDCFKEYNDTYGHQQGDNLLKKVGQELIQNTRIKSGQDEIVYSVGGDEYAVILDQTSLDQGRIVGERLRSLIEEICQDEEVTASIGLASYQPHDSVETLIHRADDALYKAKHNGKNRVETVQS